jgi:hypothetical protein
MTGPTKGSHVDTSKRNLPLPSISSHDRPAGISMRGIAMPSNRHGSTGHSTRPILARQLQPEREGSEAFVNHAWLGESGERAHESPAAIGRGSSFNRAGERPQS